MKLTETTITSKIQLDDILDSLNSMRLNREIKLIRGNFDSGTSIIDAEFKIKGTIEVWCIYCVNDGHGGGTLSKKN